MTKQITARFPRMLDACYACSHVAPNLFELLQRHLPLAVPPENVALVGSWTRSTRQVDGAPSRVGREGSVVEVVDAIWKGTVDCKVPTVGMAFLQVGDEIHWAKSAPAAFGQSLEVSLTAHADDLDGRATLGSGWEGNQLPGVPVCVVRDGAGGFRMEALSTTTGVPHVLCALDGATLFIALVQGALARTGRCRNWHLRPQPAALLPAELQMLFTQRRAGVWRARRGEPAGAR